jgi:hypothetical protein
VQEVGDNLSVLQPGLLPDGFIARARLAEALEHEPAVEEQVEPLAQGTRKAGDTERTQPLPHLGRGGTKDPLLDLAVQTVEVASDLDRVGESVFTTDILAVPRIEAGVGDSMGLINAVAKSKLASSKGKSRALASS